MQKGTPTNRVTATAESASPGDAVSTHFIGRWNRLVSHTNWEKGRIICQWREALVADGAPAGEYADETWAARVGGISSQHVGRLRRVYLRFGEVYADYDGLYWSHFFAALDWLDAEMWLQGAIDGPWSVAQMRGKRWETLGAPDDLKPRDEDIVASEESEDAPDADEIDTNSAAQIVPVQPVSAGSSAVGPDEPHPDTTPSEVVGETVRLPPRIPFENVPELPDDLTDAVEQVKIAILAHKLRGWIDVSREDVLKALDALKALVSAPSDGESGT